MAKRGRPRYPDILTPRESEVMALLREGLTNEQIAERLRVSRDGVKYHVSEILSKLGVTTREEAATWTPEEARPWWMGAFAFLFWPLKHLPFGAAATAAGAVTVVATAGGIALLAWGLAITNSDDDAAGLAQIPTADAPTAAPGSYCLPQFGDNGVAGGKVDSGPFTFGLALYSDPAIKSQQEADHPSRASDIPGVGFRATWIYSGPTTELGPQAWGLLNNVVSDIEGGIEGPAPLDRPELRAGGSGGRDGGGVVLAPDAKDGDRIGLGIRVRVLEGTYGAALFFTLRKQDGTMSACDVTVTQWTESSPLHPSPAATVIGTADVGGTPVPTESNHAQGSTCLPATNGIISGRVAEQFLDASGSVIGPSPLSIGGATVQLFEYGLSATTDEGGCFAFDVAASEEHPRLVSARASASGYGSLTLANVPQFGAGGVALQFELVRGGPDKTVDYCLFEGLPQSAAAQEQYEVCAEQGKLTGPAAAGPYNAGQCGELALGPSPDIAAPANLTVRWGPLPDNPDASGVLLSWQDNADNETCYVAERRAAGTTEWQQAVFAPSADRTEADDRNFDAPGAYCYRVFAGSQAGRSQYSNEACVLVPEATTHGLPPGAAPPVAVTPPAGASPATPTPSSAVTPRSTE